MTLQLKNKIKHIGTVEDLNKESKRGKDYPGTARSQGRFLPTRVVCKFKLNLNRPHGPGIAELR